MRKLATIQRIARVDSIPGADSIEKIGFENISWVCVSAKNTFKVGDLCVYFEIDSFLPEKPIFEFLRKSSYKKMYTGEEGFRLRTVKLRGQVSQGLAIPLQEFEDITVNSVGIDLTKSLGILKYEREPMFSAEGDIISDYPGYTPRSGQERIQNLPDYFQIYTNVLFERTRKLDGTSVSFIRYMGETMPAGHNTVFEKNEKFTPWKMAMEIGLDLELDKVAENITIQGEFVGPKIQGNPEGLKHTEYRVYNIFDIDKGRFMLRSERLAFIAKYELSLVEVPFLEEVRIFEKFDNVEDILAYSEGTLDSGKQKEGDVYKSTELINGEVISFKVISNKFLLKEK